MKKVAVYGTLRKGQYNHQVLGTSAKYKGTATISGFKMYGLGAFPGVVRGDGHITVELYEDADIKQLDVLESEGFLYSRQTENILGEDYFIYTFIPPVVKYPEIVSGDWLKRGN